MFNKMFIDVTENIIRHNGWELSAEQAVQLVSGKDTFDLITCANKIRERFKKKKAFRCAIINAKSGACSEDCAFCAQSGHHATNIKKYNLVSKEKMVETGMEMALAGATHFSMVVSGKSLTAKELDVVCEASEILKNRTNLTLCASLGMLNSEKAQRLKTAGIGRYHHNLETARSYFSHICTTHDYDEDIATIRLARQAGMEVCSGGILGMGETWQHRVELAFTLKELGVDSVPINFLNPIAGTPLGDRPLLSPMEALKCISLYRFIHPAQDITICGGREITLRDFQSWVFMAGANGIMIGHYLTTFGRHIDMDVNMIEELGMTYAD